MIPDGEIPDRSRHVRHRDRHARAEQPLVFLAESDPHWREAAAAMLRMEGYAVVATGDGVELVNALIRTLTGDPPRAPDLLVMETHLPGWSGLEVLRRLRRFDHKTPVILLRTAGDEYILAQADALGVNCVLEDPFQDAALCTAARALLAR